jgi:AhpD family alkylhydroperoxidase
MVAASRVTDMALVDVLGPDQAPLLAAPYYTGGDPGPIAATLAHVPELLELALPFIGTVLSASSIDFRTKEIVILRTSCVMGCRYCIDSHTPVALDSGLTDTQVRALRDEPGFALYDAFPSDRDRALLAWTDEVAGGKGSVDQTANSAITAAFEQHEIVELTLLIATTVLLNRYATALQLPVGDGTATRLAADGFERAA